MAAAEHARNLMAIELKNLAGTNREELSHLRTNLKKKLVAAESEVNHSVQFKLDAMKRAMDIMTETEEGVKSTLKLMQNIDQRIQLTNTSISKFETLKRVHNARENIQKIISKVEFFAQVPDKVASLLRILDTESYRMKEVYIELIKLKSLRNFFLDQISSQQQHLQKCAMREQTNVDATRILTESCPFTTFDIQLTRDTLEHKWGMILVMNDREQQVCIDSFLPGARACQKDPKSGQMLRSGDIIQSINSFSPATDFKSIVNLYDFMKQHHTLEMTIRRLNSREPDLADRQPSEHIRGSKHVDEDERFCRKRPKGEVLKSQEAQLNKALQNVEKHLISIPELSTRLREKIFENLDNILDLAEKSPSDLVMSFEIIEMHQEYMDRLKIKKIRSLMKAHSGEHGLYEFDLGTSTSLNEDEAMWTKIKSDAVEKLTQSLRKKIEGVFISVAEDDSIDPSEVNEDGTISKAQIILLAGKRILDIMAIYNDEVVPCLPPNYKALELFLEAVEDFLLDQVMEAVDSLGRENHFIFNLINFLERFVVQVELFGLKRHHVCWKFRETSDKLIRIYEERLKKQIMIWYGNIKDQPKECIQSDELGGILITTTPEDIFNILNSQIEVSRERLSLSRLKDVINSVIDVLAEIRRDSIQMLRENFTSLSPEHIAAAVNDNQRMHEKCENFASCISADWLPDHSDPTLLLKLEEVSNGFLSISAQSIHFLTKLILEELHEPAISKIFGRDWEAGGQYVATIIATLQDYLTDIKIWLPEFFYSKFVHDVLSGVIGKYVVALCQFSSQCDDSYTFKSELNVAKRVLHDLNCIKNFFVRPAQLEMLRKGGLRGDISEALAEEFLPMNFLASLIGAAHVSAVQEEMQYFLSHFGKDGLYIIKSAVKMNPSVDKTEKTRSMEIASKMFEKVKALEVEGLERPSRWVEDKKRRGSSSAIYNLMKSSDFDNSKKGPSRLGFYFS